MRTPCPAPFNLADYVLARGRATPDKVALAVLGPARTERWSYGRLEAEVRGTAAGLLERGLVPGDRVLLRLGDRPRFPVAFLACIAAGLVPVPTSAALTVPEITRLTALVAPALIMAEAGISLPDPCPCPILFDLDALARTAPADFAMGDPDRLAYLVFTSGTSGHPRAVAHAHRAIWARRMMWDGWYGLRSDDRLMHAGAFNWTFTLGTGLLDPWSVGATALIPAHGTQPGTIPLLLERNDATIIAAVPGIFRKMLSEFEHMRLPRLRHGLSAGEKLPETLRRRWQAATGTDLHEALGMSECSTFISGSPERPAPTGTLGYPQPGRRIAVLDAAGRELPPGRRGRLAVHRSDPGLMLGYLPAGDGDAPKGTPPVLPLTGAWFVTGDRVRRRADGAVEYLGRGDDMLTAGGYRVAPAEIEAAFADAPGLTDCAAIGHEVRPGTFVIALAYAGPSDENTLGAHASTRLARYKQPRVFLRLAALPRNANGKLDRRALRDALKDAT